MKAIGLERYDLDDAKEEADVAWRTHVAHHFGQKYVDLNHARHLSYTCNQSSTGGRKSEGAAAAVRKFLHQCEIEAIPCLAHKKPVDR